MSVYCAATDCKHNSKTGRCTAKRVTLSWHSVNTVWQGRQEFWKCKQFEQSYDAKAMSEFISKWKEEHKEEFERLDKING